MSNLLDIFMPEDLCARCAEGEPVDDVWVTVEAQSGERAKLHFCSYRCMEAFVRGARSVRELEDVF